MQVGSQGARDEVLHAEGEMQLPVPPPLVACPVQRQRVEARVVQHHVLVGAAVRVLKITPQK